MMDSVTLEVVRNALQSVAEEMGVTLTRTALSPNIKDRRDCSTAVYTADGRLVAQAEHIPLHLGLMPTVVKAVLREYPLSAFEPGDAVIINDPYISGSHLPDVCIISPVFYKGCPIALVANLAHHVDMGGAVPGSMSTTATEIFQEGLRIPPVKIRSGGVINKELLRLFTNNVRTGTEFSGDIQAQLNANDVGGKRLTELTQKYGSEKLQAYMSEIINYTERRLRSGLDIIPQGSYRFEDYLEGDGLDNTPLNICVSITRRDDGLVIDFTGTHRQVSGPVNATRGVTLACVCFAVKSVVDPDLPSSEGLINPLEVITPPGTLVNPNFPAPVAHANINTAQRITDVLLGALARAAPHRVPAAGTGSMSNFTIGGYDPARSRYYSYVETYGGGQGAKYHQDGMDGVHVNMTNTRNTPVEVIEISYPLRVEEYGLIADSGGPGRYRGGMGLQRKITVLESPATVTVSTERVRIKPWGLGGGNPGSCAGVHIKDPPGSAHASTRPEVTGKFTRPVSPGATLTLQTAGGGGYGCPLNREPELVRRDALWGLISAESARRLYGVVLTGENLEIKWDETVKLRKEMSAAGT